MNASSWNELHIQLHPFPFTSGSSHITQDEIMAYSQADFEDDDVILDENHSNHPELTDDDSSDDTDIFN